MNSGLKNTIVRAGFFMDNYTTGFHAPMIERGTIALATGNGRSALVAGTDVGAFIAAALSKGMTGEYLVTGPEALDHYEVAELLSLKLGRTITYTPLSDALLTAYYASRALDAKSIEYGLTLYRAYRNHATAAVSDGFRQADRERTNVGELSLHKRDAKLFYRVSSLLRMASNSSILVLTSGQR